MQIWECIYICISISAYLYLRISIYHLYFNFFWSSDFEAQIYFLVQTPDLYNKGMSPVSQLYVNGNSPFQNNLTNISSVPTMYQALFQAVWVNTKVDLDLSHSLIQAQRVYRPKESTCKRWTQPPSENLSINSKLLEPPRLILQRFTFCRTLVNSFILIKVRKWEPKLFC